MVFVVLEGEITVILHTTQFNAKKGDSFYIPPKVCVSQRLSSARTDRNDVFFFVELLQPHQSEGQGGRALLDPVPV